MSLIRPYKEDLLGNEISVHCTVRLILTSQYTSIERIHFLRRLIQSISQGTLENIFEVHD